MNWIRKNLVLVSGIVLPVVMVVAFLILQEAPRVLKDSTNHDFLVLAWRYDYSTPRSFHLDYEVREERLVGRVVPTNDGKPQTGHQYPVIYRYLANDQAFEEVPIELPEDLEEQTREFRFPVRELDQLVLSTSRKSPDGFEFENQGYRSRGGLLGEIFGMGRRSHYVLVLKHESDSFPLPDITGDGSIYAGNTRFLGWVISGS